MCFDSWAQGFICEEELIRYISLSLCVSVMELQARSLRIDVCVHGIISKDHFHIIPPVHACYCHNINIPNKSFLITYCLHGWSDSWGSKVGIDLIGVLCYSTYQHRWWINVVENAVIYRQARRENHVGFSVVFSECHSRSLATFVVSTMSHSALGH